MVTCVIRTLPSMLSSAIPYFERLVLSDRVFLIERTLLNYISSSNSAVVILGAICSVKNWLDEPLGCVTKEMIKLVLQALLRLSGK